MGVGGYEIASGSRETGLQPFSALRTRLQMTIESRGARISTVSIARGRTWRRNVAVGRNGNDVTIVLKSRAGKWFRRQGEGKLTDQAGTDTIEPDEAATGPDARDGAQSRVRRAAC
ncbi:hypothetical protein SAHL_08230 [Salinisphaera orenii YIM 95161]|uniref:Uncharacterized protein n=1 Tax=Salinisphaera orenii YIM 95161 TaxID=1051139 RepID=A0A423PX93_9GAMM|nr:hypothetical protein SAHL_08230 [Salinisphaera halophila YIM 95161]